MLETMLERMGKKSTDPRQEMIFLLYGRSVQRFHTVPMLHGVTLAQHQFGVAWFCYLLTKGSCSVDLLMAALSHDMAEQVWSDVSAPAKRALEIGDLLDKNENKTLAENNMLFTLTLGQKFVLKLADCMEGMLSCIHERRLGNRYAEAPYERFHSYVAELVRNVSSYDSLHQRCNELVAALDVLWKETLIAPKTGQIPPLARSTAPFV